MRNLLTFFCIDYCYQSLLGEPKHFALKTIFATRETTFLDLFKFTQQQLQLLQQQTLKKNQTYNEICHRNW